MVHASLTHFQSTGIGGTYFHFVALDGEINCNNVVKMRVFPHDRLLISCWCYWFHGYHVQAGITLGCVRRRRDMATECVMLRNYLRGNWGRRNNTDISSPDSSIGKGSQGKPFLSFRQSLKRKSAAAKITPHWALQKRGGHFCHLPPPRVQERKEAGLQPPPPQPYLGKVSLPPQP